MIWRKPVIIVFLLSLFCTGHAQIAKGTLMTGGNIGFSYNSDHQDYVNTFSFNFAPVFGCFVAKNFVLGIAPFAVYTKSSGSYSYIDSTVNPPKSTSVSIFQQQTSLGLGPYARYYIKIGPRVYVYIHASPSIMATWEKQSNDANTPVQRTVTANWVIGPGLSVMVAKNVAIELALYYQGTYHRSANFVNGNLLGEPSKPFVDNGMVFNVGFQVYLDRKKKNTQAAKVN